MLRVGLMMVLAVMLAVVGGCQGSGYETPQSPASVDNQPTGLREPPSPAITGLKAELIDDETPLERGRVSWSTRWRLCWAPTPGAVAYVVTTATPEGVSPPGETRDNCFALSVANGYANRPGERPTRSQQLSLMQTMLSVSVAARMSDGTVGPASPDVAVGAQYP